MPEWGSNPRPVTFQSGSFDHFTKATYWHIAHVPEGLHQLVAAFSNEINRADVEHV